MLDYICHTLRKIWECSTPAWSRQTGKSRIQRALLKAVAQGDSGRLAVWDKLGAPTTRRDLPNPYHTYIVPYRAARPARDHAGRIAAAQATRARRNRKRQLELLRQQEVHK